ncbi:hypothetical protein NECAME_01043 [Necator americanus]|uniref:Uncharacterized protein n=1 Tax=Necator americanus TaxID=51031 RepID=W2SKF3_NECAM|nr:hypothetical protein NECAME_01043 [Necator americanus]ETN70095.1 hypothetical protein NECAME_01043 [Necator americanus]
MMSSYHMISHIVYYKWAKFLTTTFMWNLTHASAGFVVYVYHKEFRPLMLHPWLLLSRKTEFQGTSFPTLSKAYNNSND